MGRSQVDGGGRGGAWRASAIMDLKYVVARGMGCDCEQLIYDLVLVKICFYVSYEHDVSTYLYT